MYEANKDVVDRKQQYLIWFGEREISPGRKNTGKSGQKQECLDYIKEVWTDMQSLSLRQKMAESAR